MFYHFSKEGLILKNVNRQRCPLQLHLPRIDSLKLLYLFLNCETFAFEFRGININLSFALLFCRHITVFLYSVNGILDDVLLETAWLCYNQELRWHNKRNLYLPFTVNLVLYYAMHWIINIFSAVVSTVFQYF